MRRENNYAAKHKGNLPTITQHIRAELDALARAVRKLIRYDPTGMGVSSDYSEARDDVLALIKERKK